MISYEMEYDRSDIKKAVFFGFTYMESRDDIVGSIYVSPKLAKKIVLAIPDEVEFDYIPEGIGLLRTAYLKFSPAVRENEIRYVSHDGNTQVKVFLI